MTTNNQKTFSIILFFFLIFNISILQLLSLFDFIFPNILNKEIRSYLKIFEFSFIVNIALFYYLFQNKTLYYFKIILYLFSLYLYFTHSNIDTAPNDPRTNLNIFLSSISIFIIYYITILNILYSIKKINYFKIIKVKTISFFTFIFFIASIITITSLTEAPHSVVIGKTKNIGDACSVHK